MRSGIDLRECGLEAGDLVEVVVHNQWHGFTGVIYDIEPRQIHVLFEKDDTARFSLASSLRKLPCLTCGECEREFSCYADDLHYLCQDCR